MAEYMPFFICHIYDCSVWVVTWTLMWFTCLASESVCHGHPEGLVRLSPTEAMGGAWSQSPECGAEAIVIIIFRYEPLAAEA